MNRRSFGLAALCSGALFVGAFAGGATSVSSVYASAADAPPSASRSPQQAPAKRPPPIQCKTTKECPEDNVCTKVGDHKECTPAQIRVPTAPVVT